MNRKFLMYGFFALALSSTEASFAASGPKTLFYGSKLLGGAAVPAITMSITYKKNEGYKKNKSSDVFKAQQEKFPVPENVKEFALGRMKLVGVHDAQSIPVVQVNKEYHSACAIGDDCVLFMRETEVKKLNEILCKIADGKKLDPNQAQVCDKMAMTISHESWHYMNEDGKTRILEPVAGAVVVQGGSSVLSYAFNTACNIKTPQTWKRAGLRSLGAFAAIPLKAVVTDWVEFGVSREIEAGADDFACKNAQSREELVAFHNYWKATEDIWKEVGEKHNQNPRAIAFNKDPWHPYAGDRAKAIQKYIEEWDKNHPKV